LIDCTFGENEALSGAAIAVGGGHIDIFRSRILRGFAFVGGGLAITEMDSQVAMVSSLVAENRADAYGGGVAGGSGGLALTNCTVANNTAGVLGSGIIVGEPTAIHNSIVWGNEAGGRANETAQIEGIEFADIHYSNVQGWSGQYGGEGNMGVDPMFVDPDGQYGPLEADFRLQADSPCINAGLYETIDPVPWNIPPPDLDLDGKPRVLCGNIDLGAYEFGLLGDVDCNFAVDLDDFAAWASCATGPSAADTTGTAATHEPSPPPLSQEERGSTACAAFDADGDGDKDLRDLAAVFSGFSMP
jgi:hypothetical protein